MSAARPPGSSAEPPLRVAVFSFDRPEHACGYIRIETPARALARQQRVEVRRAVTQRRLLAWKRVEVDERLIAWADVLLVQRTFPRAANAALVDRLFASGRPVVYDTDDLLTELPPERLFSHATEADRAAIADCARRARLVTVATAPLAAEMRTYNANVTVLPNLVDLDLWRAPEARPGVTPVIAFSGTKTHRRDLELIAEPLLRLAERLGDRVRLRFHGSVPPPLQRLANAEFIPFEGRYARYARSFAAAPPVVAVVPLTDHRFNRSKSNIKWLEYAGCGVPGVFSRVAPYADCVDHGRTGFLAGPEPEQWVELLSALLSDAPLRARVAEAARAEVAARFSAAAGAPAYEAAWRSVLEGWVERSETHPHVPSGVSGVDDEVVPVRRSDRSVWPDVVTSTIVTLHGRALVTTGPAVTH